MSITGKLKMMLRTNSERSRTVRNNSVWSLAIRIFGMAVQLVQVPVVLSYLDSTFYGIYLTITSIVMWTHNFDFGLGTGLRYKLTEAIAHGDTRRCKELVSTAYLSLAGIMSIVALCFLPVIFLLDWQYILNYRGLENPYYALCVLTVLLTILTQFVLDLISVVLQAHQKSAVTMIFRPLANAIAVVGVCVLKFTGDASLFNACIMLTMPLLLVLLTTNVLLYARKFKDIKPSWDSFKKNALSDIYTMGLKFFIISLSIVVVFNSANVLLSHLIQPYEVSVYQTSYQYFNTLTVLHSVFLIPMWAAITDAYVKEDFAWIKNYMKKLWILNGVFSVLLLLALMLSQPIFHLWLGNKLSIPVSLTLWLSGYFLLNFWSCTFNSFLVGVGRLHVSMYVAIFKIIVFIPLAVLLIKAMGVPGLVLASVLVSNIPDITVGFTQFRMIMSRRAVGIWNK